MAITQTSVTAATAPTSLDRCSGEFFLPPRLVSLAGTSGCMRTLSQCGHAGCVSRQPMRKQEATGNVSLGVGLLLLYLSSSSYSCKEKDSMWGIALGHRR